MEETLIERVMELAGVAQQPEEEEAPDSYIDSEQEIQEIANDEIETAIIDVDVIEVYKEVIGDTKIKIPELFSSEIGKKISITSDESIGDDIYSRTILIIPKSLLIDKKIPINIFLYIMNGIASKDEIISSMLKPLERIRDIDRNGPVSWVCKEEDNNIKIEILSGFEAQDDYDFYYEMPTEDLG